MGKVKTLRGVMRELTPTGYSERKMKDLERAAGVDDLSVRGGLVRLQRTLEKVGLNPEEEIAKFAADKRNDPELILKALMWLGNKRTPDLKSVDVNVEENKSISIEIVRFGDVEEVEAADIAKRVVPELSHE